MKLSTQQKTFLNFLLTEHGGIGWSCRIERIIIADGYNPNDEHAMMNVDCIIRDWRSMVDGSNTKDVLLYGKPTKYLR